MCETRGAFNILVLFLFTSYNCCTLRLVHHRLHQVQKQQEKLAFERHFEEKQKEHTQLLLMNTSRKENILNSVRQVR